MLIYVVRANDTLRAIARRYGSTAEYLAYINQLSDPDRLVPGMTIIIPLEHPPARSEAEVNAYVYPNVSSASLDYALPLLTFLSPFSYSFDASGRTAPINVSRLVSAARGAGAAPLMVVTNIAESGFSGSLAHGVLTQSAPQDELVRSIIETLRTGGFAGVNVDFEYLYSFDRDSYSQFIARLVSELHPLGYYVYVALAPKVSRDQQGLLYSAHDYEAIGAAADRVILMTYEWGYTYGEPQAISPVNRIRQVLDYAVTAMPAGKILMGFSNYAYNWTLPWRQGTAAAVLSNAGAVSLAVGTGSEIRFDERAQAPYFNYTDASGKRHVVWFEDARSVDARLRLVREYGLAGISVWTADRLYRPLWELVRAHFVPEKLL